MLLDRYAKDSVEIAVKASGHGRGQTTCPRRGVRNLDGVEYSRMNKYSIFFNSLVPDVTRTIQIIL